MKDLLKHIFTIICLLSSFESFTQTPAKLNQQKIKKSTEKITTNDSIIYIKQYKGDSINFREIDQDLSPSVILSILAVLVSVLAIYFPIRFNTKSDRKSTFFKVYEYWNTDFMLRSRRRFWKILRENHSDEHKVSLKDLYEKNSDDYHTYESVYDLLNDIAKLYNEGQIDKGLVKTLMITFIRSYGNALQQHFEYYESGNSYFVKMSAKYYQPVLNLKRELCHGEEETYASFKDLENPEIAESNSNPLPDVSN